MDAREEARIETAALIAIVVAGIAVRALFLSRPMQLDEAYTYNEYASRPWLDGISRYTLPNNHLLNTLLAHASVAALGDDPWAVRLPAFLAGIALIPSTFAMVARLRDRATGLLASALVASSGPLIEYSTNARGYTLVTLITVLLVVLAARIREDGGRARHWVGLSVLPALGFFAIPIMLYPYGGTLLWLLLTSRWPGGRGGRPVRLDRLVVSVIFAAMLTVVLYLPAMIRMGTGPVVSNTYVSPRPMGEVVRELPGSLGRAWLQWNGDIPRALSALFLLGWGVSIARRAATRRGFGGPTSLLVVVLGWSVSVALAQRVVPYERVWVFAIPLYSACVAEGLAGLPGRAPDDSRRRRAGLGPALAVLLCLSLSALAGRGEALGPSMWGTLHHGDAIARFLGPVLRPDDGVVALTPCDAPLKYEFLHHRIPVEHLYDYRVTRARRVFVAVNRPGQEVSDALAQFHLTPAMFTPPRLVRDYGSSALYQLDRR